MRCPPEESGRKTVDIHFTADGIFNAVLFWYTLELAPGITLSSAPISGRAPGVNALHFPQSLAVLTLVKLGLV